MSAWANLHPGLFNDICELLEEADYCSLEERAAIAVSASSTALANIRQRGHDDEAERLEKLKYFAVKAEAKKEKQ